MMLATIRGWLRRREHSQSEVPIIDVDADMFLSTEDIHDLRAILYEPSQCPEVTKAVKVLQWLDRNREHPERRAVQIRLDEWQPTRKQALEAQARYGFAYLHTDASADPRNAEKTKKVLAWLKNYLTGRKLKIAADFLASEEAKQDLELTRQVGAWYKAQCQEHEIEPQWPQLLDPPTNEEYERDLDRLHDILREMRDALGEMQKPKPNGWCGYWLQKDGNPYWLPSTAASTRSDAWTNWLKGWLPEEDLKDQAARKRGQRQIRKQGGRVVKVRIEEV